MERTDITLKCLNGPAILTRGAPINYLPIIGVGRLESARAANRFSYAALYQAFIDQITPPVCPHCANGAKHLLLSCPVERQRYFGDSIDIADVFQNYENLVEFLITSGDLLLP